MAQLWDWLGQYRALWEAQFQRLDGVLDSLPPDPPSDTPPSERTPQ